MYTAKGEHGQAIADYGTVIELYPTDASAYNSRGWAYFQAGEAAQGLPDVEKALELQPDDANSLDTRGRIFEALGRKEEAIADYRRAIALAPPKQDLRETKKSLERLQAGEPAKEAASPQSRPSVDVVSNLAPLTFNDRLFMSPDGQLLAIPTGSRGRSSGLMIWSVSAARPLRTLRYYAFFTAGAFLPGGRIVTGHKDGATKIWDVASGAALATVSAGRSDREADTKSVTTITADAEGKSIAVGHRDGDVVLWDLVNRRRLATFHIDSESTGASFDGEGIMAVRFLAGGKRLLALTRKTATFLDVDSQKRQKVAEFKEADKVDVVNNSAVVVATVGFFQDSIISDSELLFDRVNPSCGAHQLFLFDLAIPRSGEKVIDPASPEARPAPIGPPSECVPKGDAPPRSFGFIRIPGTPWAQMRVLVSDGNNFGEPTVVPVDGTPYVMIAKWNIPGIAVLDRKEPGH